MTEFLTSILRDFAQKGVGVVAVWLVAHGFDVPAAVTDWAVLALVSGGLLLWTAAVRFLETRQSGFARGLARVLMLGIGAKPVYPPAEPEALAALRGRTS